MWQIERYKYKVPLCSAGIIFNTHVAKEDVTMKG